MRYISFISILLISSSVFSPAFSQISDPNAQRVDRLERDIMLMQRQLSRSGVRVDTSGTTNESLTPSAELEVRLSGIEESMRELRGKFEENEFEIRRLNENFEKFQKDAEFRFNELKSAPAATEPAAASPKSSPEPLAREALPAEAEAASTQGELTTAGDGILRAPEAVNPETDTYDTPRDLYNYAFRLLNQTRYEDAASSFAEFTKKYPKDPLIGNAYYWQGETYYIRRDYVNAADAFRQGFEALPGGPKAPDNLLKLAMSLDALDRSKEACIVLGQITTKFKKTSVSIVDKAAKEQKRMGCE